ncbi:MAG: bifunctional DNA-formamidopyrimidine glycosylase/DNA-(apurinic or apyrimidinic site) lyase [Candidatus Promineifilaceae bacterium]|jgi:formamidopyrimidine-DNA glycosylase
MPELPEVETVARSLRPNLIGLKITGVRNTWPRHIDRPVLAEFIDRVRDRTIMDVSRRGKFLIFPLDNEETLIIHLRMSGHLAVIPAQTPADKHTHTIFELANGQELRFRDTRKFGRVYLVSNHKDVVGKLGPEPLDKGFTVETLADILDGKSRLLKPFLLDQTMIAGIGNIYADEALFYAGLKPGRKTDTLDALEIKKLHEGIQYVLQLGIRREGATISTYLKPDGEKGSMQEDVKVFRRTGEPCFRCGEPIQRIILGGRSTHYCENCQK